MWSIRTELGQILMATALALVLSSCADDRTEIPVDSGATLRDSLGITIVESPAPTNPGENWWTVERVPRLTIGARDGEEAQVLSNIRDVVQRSDGSVVLVDGASNELRYFDSTGVHLFSTGGSGDGPGEFRQASGIMDVSGRSVLAYDLFASRVTWFGPDGSLERTDQLTQIPSFSPGMAPLGLAPDGRVVVRGIATPAPPGFGPDPVPAPVYLADLEAQELEPIADVPFAIGATANDGTPLSVFPMLVPLQVPSTRGLWIGTPTDFKLTRIGWDGEVARIVRFGDPPEPFSAAEIQQIESWFRERLPPPPGDAASPEVFRVLAGPPTFGRIIVDAVDHVWVQEASAESDPEEWEFAAPLGTSTWRVLDPDGIWLGSVTVPDRFVPSRIGEDYVLGVWTDEDGVEFVHLYGLSRE